MLSVRGLTKRFGEFTAVDDLSFDVRQGLVYGFLGQNGAGKSTTIRMLLTLIKPDRGQIEFWGESLFSNRREILSKIGAIVEKPDLYKYLSAEEHLDLMARLGGQKPIRSRNLELLEKVGLAHRAKSKVGTYSQGMRQRLALACALVNDPQLLILDEPTNGLDPQGIADMRKLILQLCHAEGKTVFVSSHLLSEIEMIADQVLIIHRGKKVVEESMTSLVAKADSMKLAAIPEKRYVLEAYFLSLTTS